MKDKILIILPAYNEGKVIGEVINSIKYEGFTDILVVDDHSKDNTSQVAKLLNTKVITHKKNKGAGAATATGIEYAKENDYDFAVLLDSDGQHCAKDIKKLLKYSNKFDVVIGSRMVADISKMPLQRKIANFVGSFATWFFFGKFLWDSQSGFKVLNKRAISKIKITFDRYEFSSEMAGEIHKYKLSVKEVPIKVIYTKHSIKNKGSGQSIFNGFKMILRFLRKNRFWG